MIEEKRFDLRQGNAAGNGPAHAVMLLTLSNHQIVGFFNPIAGISQSQQVPERITGDICTAFFKIGAEVRNTVYETQMLLRQTFQILHRLSDIPCPQDMQQLLQSGISFFLSRL